MSFLVSQLLLELTRLIWLSIQMLLLMLDQLCLKTQPLLLLLWVVSLRDMLAEFLHCLLLAKLEGRISLPIRPHMKHWQMLHLRVHLHWLPAVSCSHPQVRL